MSLEEAKPLLSEWARSCHPPISRTDLSAALKSAKRALERAAADTVGCLLRGKAMPAATNPPHPPQGVKWSVVPSTASISKPGATQGIGYEQPIYLGPLGELAKEVRELIENFEDDYGYRPSRILIGTSFSGELPIHIAELPVERWRKRGHSVVG